MTDKLAKTRRNSCLWLASSTRDAIFTPTCLIQRSLQGISSGLVHRMTRASHVITQGSACMSPVDEVTISPMRALVRAVPYPSSHQTYSPPLPVPPLSVFADPPFHSVRTRRPSTRPTTTRITSPTCASMKERRSHPLLHVVLRGLQRPAGKMYAANRQTSKGEMGSYLTSSGSHGTASVQDPFTGIRVVGRIGCCKYVFGALARGRLC